MPYGKLLMLAPSLDWQWEVLDAGVVVGSGRADTRDAADTAADDCTRDRTAAAERGGEPTHGAR
jgi:hypothetical protein